MMRIGHRTGLQSQFASYSIESLLITELPEHHEESVQWSPHQNVNRQLDLPSIVHGRLLILMRQSQLVEAIQYDNTKQS